MRRNAPSSLVLRPSSTDEIEVQLAFEVTNALSWRDIVAEPALAGAEPVRQRSSGTLFGLTRQEYETLQALIIERNPELAAAFSAVETTKDEGPKTKDRRRKTKDAPLSSFVLRPSSVKEEPASYEPLPAYTALPPVRSLAELQEQTGLPAEMLEEARDLLEDTGQIILSGPPGTGKTWLARGLAALVACNPARVSIVQFHPSTSYEDFVEGLKPRLDAGGNVTYAVIPGIFVRLCEQAQRDPDHHYVLVIDEINRAPLSRVFGELLYALEYRGPQGAVELSVSAGVGRTDQLFFVPENLLIIGTMNSTDRSIALVDYALRRRFRFVELEPNAAILDSWLAARDNSPETRRIVIELFEALNKRLSDALDPDHRLGHSYFMLDPLNAPGLNRLWRTAIRPLVAEYFIPPAGEVEEYGALFAEAAEELARVSELMPQSAIVLREFGSLEVALSREEYAALRARYAKQIEVALTEQAGVYRLTARDYVGRVGLPGGRILVIQPKVEVANLFYMLCAQAGLAGFHPPPTGLARNPDIFPFVLAALLHSVEDLLRAGLYRDYKLHEERLRFVRGRILLDDQLRQGGLLHRQSCRYADLTADTPENRVVAATLRYLPVLLASSGEKSSKRCAGRLARFCSASAG